LRFAKCCHRGSGEADPTRAVESYFFFFFAAFLAFFAVFFFAFFAIISSQG
jgi:hypothetical protein